jgi:hypothetical protein
MQNTPTKNRWKRAFLVFIFVVGGVVGVLTGSSIYHVRHGWLAGLLFGVFCGGLASIGTLVVVSGLLRFVGTVLYLRSKKEMMWRFVPAWLFLGVYGLLLFGGGILLGVGKLTGSRFCFAVGGLAMLSGFGVIALLALVGLCILGWKRLWKRV